MVYTVVLMRLIDYVNTIDLLRVPRFGSCRSLSVRFHGPIYLEEPIRTYLVEEGDE